MDRNDFVIKWKNVFGCKSDEDDPKNWAAGYTDICFCSICRKLEEVHIKINSHPKEASHIWHIENDLLHNILDRNTDLPEKEIKKILNNVKSDLDS